MITYNHFYFVTSFQRIWITLLAILWANSRQFLHYVWSNFGMYLTTFLGPYQAHFGCNWWQFLLHFVRVFKIVSYEILRPNRRLTWHPIVRELNTDLAPNWTWIKDKRGLRSMPFSAMNVWLQSGHESPRWSNFFQLYAGHHFAKFFANWKPFSHRCQNHFPNKVEAIFEIYQ